MAQGTAFWTAQTAFLDEEFDAPDIAADHALCRAIVAGRVGLHPDAWGNHDPLPLRWLVRRRPEQELPGFGQPPVRATPRLDVWNEHKPRPKPRPKLQPQLPPTAKEIDWYLAEQRHQRPPPAGTLQLTCDVCERARFGGTVDYHGDRMVKVAEIRALGRLEGWTCIAGMDRCPKCSVIGPPEDVGNGAGEHQGNEQHA